MRIYWLERWDEFGGTKERLHLTCNERFFTDVTGLGVNFDISGAQVGQAFIVSSGRKQVSVISGTMIFSSKEKYTEFIDFCITSKTGIVQIKMAEENNPNDTSARVIDVLLASCERTEAKANGTLECPTSFQTLTPWYIEDIRKIEEYNPFASTLEHADFSEEDLIPLSDGESEEISFDVKPNFGGGMAGVNFMIPEIGIVTYDNNGYEIKRTLKMSTAYEFDRTGELRITSSPQNLSVLCIRKSGDGTRVEEDLYWQLDDVNATPFIQTESGMKSRLFISVITLDGMEIPVDVDIRGKKFVESL